MEELWFQIRDVVNNSIFSGKKTRLERYGIPVVLVIIVLGIKSGLHLFFGNVVSFHLLTLAVILSAWYGGFGPGIWATILTGVLNDFLFLPPLYSFTIGEDFTLTLIFFLEGFLISIICEARRQAEDQKDEFIGFASHELKNPLAVAKGYADLIVKKAGKGGDPKLKDYALTLDSYINKTTDQVNELLDMAKIEAGRLTFHDSHFPIQRLLEDIVKDQSIVSTTHRIILKGRSGKYIDADKYRLGQVIVNLITNAIKYSPAADRVEVGVKDAKSGIVISVRDFGIGIKKQDQEKIFQRFYRVDNGKIQGLGVGLYIASEIIKRYKGKFSLKSGLGKGATFYLFLPAGHL